MFSESGITVGRAWKPRSWCKSPETGSWTWKEDYLHWSNRWATPTTFIATTGWLHLLPRLLISCHLRKQFPLLLRNSSSTSGTRAMNLHWENLGQHLAHLKKVVVHCFLQQFELFSKIINHVLLLLSLHLFKQLLLDGSEYRHLLLDGGIVCLLFTTVHINHSTTSTISRFAQHNVVQVFVAD